MKILDRYIAKNFLIGYIIAFSVLIGLRIIIELFVNLDEFAENTKEVGARGVIIDILTFYAYRTTLYFRDSAGVITVVAAAFSLGRMVRNNELVAMIASGVSAKRIVGPILALVIFFTALAVADQEFVIPSISDQLVRDEDDAQGNEVYAVWFFVDGNGSLLCSPKYDAGAMTLDRPTIITREAVPSRPGVWNVTGRLGRFRDLRSGHGPLGPAQWSVRQHGSEPDSLAESLLRSVRSVAEGYCLAAKRGI
jgi:hypothetical protein